MARPMRYKKCKECGQYALMGGDFCSPKCNNAYNWRTKKARKGIEKSMGIFITFAGYDKDMLARWCKRHHGKLPADRVLFDQETFLEEMCGRQMTRGDLLLDLEEDAIYWPDGTLIKSAKNGQERMYVIKDKRIDYYEKTQ